ncbi:hypothetical protein RHMOL_Rhmol01G0233900 [Rhododendron molle]|uniref:Uncharacterized protein n=1 Tax=Rhododendron molle TaxID=49168 RepID=A0ACC0Q4F8_RHOML|nr:hypothetical protein RHMOL_Rhmol01G0233900 [Rhododendron molle]
MVAKEIWAPVFDPHGKFLPKCLGPYIIKTILSGVRFSSLISMAMSSIPWLTWINSSVTIPETS